MECSTASALPPHNRRLWSCLGHEPNKSTVMAEHIYGSGKTGGIWKATDQFQSTFCDHHSYSNAALSTQCWLNPNKGEKWDLGGGLTHPRYWSRNTLADGFCCYKRKHNYSWLHCLFKNSAHVQWTCGVFGPASKCHPQKSVSKNMWIP